jgi:hypothetical protein
VNFLLESTWLALTVWMTDHGPLFSALALTGLRWHPATFGKRRFIAVPD